MSKFYIVAGPTTIGNRMSYYGSRIENGKFAVVEEGEYTNGGRGPISANGIVNRTRKGAEKLLDEMS